MPDLIPTDRKIVRAGRDSFRTACPIHGGERLSFGMKRMPDGDWHFNCWACGEKGDVFALVMALERCTFRQALERLAKDVAPLLSAPTPKRKRDAPKWLMVCAGKGCGNTCEVEAGVDWAIEKRWPRGGWTLAGGDYWCARCFNHRSHPAVYVDAVETDRRSRAGHVFMQLLRALLPSNKRRAA